MSDATYRPLLAEHSDVERHDRNDVVPEPSKPAAMLCCCATLLSLTVAVLFIASPMVCYNAYKSASVTLGSGDVLSLTIQAGDVFSGVFCSEYSVQATDPNSVGNSFGSGEAGEGEAFKVYALSRKAQIAKDTVRRHLQERGVLGNYAYPKYFVYHVTDSGGIDVTACSNDTDLALSLCQTEHDAKTFIQNGFNVNCYPQCFFSAFECRMHEYQPCSLDLTEMNDKNLMRRAIIVVSRDTSGFSTADERVEIDFDIHGPVYKLDNVVASQDGTNTAILPVPIDSLDILYEVPLDAAVNPIHLQGTCNPRILMYVCIFGAIPVVTGVFFGSVFYCLCKETKPNRTNSSSRRRSNLPAYNPRIDESNIQVNTEQHQPSHPPPPYEERQ